MALGALATVPLVLVGAAGAAPTAEPLASASGATLTAASAVLDGLVVEVATLPTSNGDVPSLRLTSTSARLTGLALHGPCETAGVAVGGVSTDAVTPTGSESSAVDGLTMFATSVVATVAGASVTWTPDSPPATSVLGDVELVDATVELATLSAPSLTTPGLRLSTRFCS